VIARAVRFGVWGVLVVALSACAGMQEGSTTATDATKTTSESPPTLYKRLGGREGIKLVVDDFVAIASADPRLSGRFQALPPDDLERVKTNVADQICEATGGPCSYLGKDMKTAHQGMGITEADLTATVEDLVKALDKHQVSEKDKNELLALLGSMKKDIIGQ
jgi:hemoglobin